MTSGPCLGIVTEGSVRTSMPYEGVHTWTKVEHFPNLIERYDVGSISLWQVRLIGEGRVIVNHSHSEPDERRGTHQGQGDLPTPEHIEGGCG